MEQPPPPPSLPSATPAKKGLSTGCILCIIGAVVIVPISIMAVLAVSPVLRKAKLLQARATAHGLVIAVKGFQTEYNRHPLPENLVVPESTTFASNGSLLNALLGKDTGINPRGIRFYDPLIARNKVNGLVEKAGQRTLLDPWGQPYDILLDFDNDGKVFDLEHPGLMLDMTVGVFSGGPDGDTATWQDNVKSW